MEEITFNGSFDEEDQIHLSLSQSLSRTLKPKFLTTLENRQKISISTKPNIKNTQSRPVLQFQNSLGREKTVTFNALTEKINQNQKVSALIDFLKKIYIFDEKLYQISKQKFSTMKNTNLVQFCEVNSDKTRKLLTFLQFQIYSGEGTLSLPDRRKIKGRWINTIPQGIFTVTYPNQSVYSGGLSQNLQREGFGTVIFANKQRLECVFSNGKAEGLADYRSEELKLIKKIRYLNGLIIQEVNA